MVTQDDGETERAVVEVPVWETRALLVEDDELSANGVAEREEDGEAVGDRATPPLA